jgi:CRP/FNR family cyclic AMP-dependent transcriptional regulator
MHSWPENSMSFFSTDADTQKVEMLKNIPIFHKLTSKEILVVHELLYERVYEKDEVVFEKGDPGHGIYIVVNGRLRVDPSHEFLKKTILDVGPGESVGELALFDEGQRSATVVAIERTVTVALFQAELSSLLIKNKNIGVKVLMEVVRVISRRARQVLSNEKHIPSL